MNFFVITASEFLDQTTCEAVFIESNKTVYRLLSPQFLNSLTCSNITNIADEKNCAAHPIIAVELQEET